MTIDLETLKISRKFFGLLLGLAMVIPAPALASGQALVEESATQISAANVKNHNANSIAFNAQACATSVQAAANNADWDQFVNYFLDGKFLENINHADSGTLVGKQQNPAYVECMRAGVQNARNDEVPFTTLAWLSVAALIGFVGLSNKKRV